MHRNDPHAPAIHPVQNPPTPAIKQAVDHGPSYSSQSVKLLQKTLTVQHQAGTYNARFDTSDGGWRHMCVDLSPAGHGTGQDFCVQVTDMDGQLLFSDVQAAPGAVDIRFHPTTNHCELSITPVGDETDLTARAVASSLLAGTRVRTENGMALIEHIKPGDMVWTQDSGFQPLVANLAHVFDGDDAWGDSARRPVMIGAGALGDGFPSCNLYTSPDFRVLLRSRVADDLLGVEEIIAPAGDLVSHPGICQVSGSGPLAFHSLVFHDHHIIVAEDTPVETFLGDPDNVAALTHLQIGLLGDRGVSLAASPKSHVRPQAPARLLRRLLDRARRMNAPLLSLPRLRDVPLS